MAFFIDHPVVDVQEMRIQPYFCVKQGNYFFSLFLGHPVYIQDNSVEKNQRLKKRVFFLFCLHELVYNGLFHDPYFTC